MSKSNPFNLNEAPLLDFSRWTLHDEPHSLVICFSLLSLYKSTVFDDNSSRAAQHHIQRKTLQVRPRKVPKVPKDLTNKFFVFYLCGPLPSPSTVALGSGSLLEKRFLCISQTDMLPVPCTFTIKCAPIIYPWQRAKRSMDLSYSSLLSSSSFIREKGGRSNATFRRQTRYHLSVNYRHGS